MPDASAPPAWWRPSRAAAAPPREADNTLPLRHAAALMVLYGHGHDLLGNPDGPDLVAAWLPGLKAGTFAVYVFFCLSGYLVMLSLLRRRGLLRYAWHRALRILPAYWLVLLACVFVLGPAATTLAPGEYFAHPGTWAHLAGNLVPVSFEWTLPGVFAHHPVPGVVNGSLWSLGLEVRWYAYLGLLLALGVATRRGLFTAVALAFLALAAWEWGTGTPDPLHYRALSATFVLAALCAHWRERLRLSAGVALVAAVAIIAAWDHAALGPLAILVLVYAVLSAAFRLPALRWPGTRDYSYGLFLWGFPVQQLLVGAWPGMAPLALFALGAVLSAGLAAATWHLVEAPSLRLKSWSWRRRGPVPAVAHQTRSSGT